MHGHLNVKLIYFIQHVKIIVTLILCIYIFVWLNYLILTINPSLHLVGILKVF